MRIKRLGVMNFRQFSGSHELSFSTDDKKNVTVVHGENGSGKTSLLNAFKWCFYGTADFDTGVDKLLNEHAITLASGNERIPMKVSVDFEHDGALYTVSREQQYRRVGSELDVEEVGGAVVEVSWKAKDGKFEKAPNPESLINQILPEKMHSYFFFNGERIEKLAAASASQEIRGAIKTLMGLETVERAKIHLDGRVKKHFTAQIKQGASQELQSLIDREAELDDAIARASAAINTEDANIQAFRDELVSIGSKLKNLEGTKKLQEERDGLNSRLTDIANEVTVINSKNQQLITERGFLAFFDEVAHDVTDILEDRRQKGELPYQIKQQFIDDLMANGKCICGADISKGSEGHSVLEHYRQRTAAAGVEEAFIATSGALRQTDWSRDDLFDQIKAGLKKRSELFIERDKHNGRLDDISKSLKESDQEDVVLLENRRAKLEKDVEDARTRRAREVVTMERDDAEREKVKKQRKELDAKSGQANLAKRRLELAEECARVIAELHEALARATRADLSERVDNTFRSIIQKDYWAEIDNDYILQIFKNVPNHGRQIVYEKSTGESQVTSLSFIASIVSLAKEQYKKGGEFFRGGLYPIVMDSPFGSVSVYRELIARHIPELADQIILLVSPAQWEGGVQKEMASRIGKQATLIYHSPKIGKAKETHFVRADSAYEYSEIEDGYHG